MPRIEQIERMQEKHELATHLIDGKIFYRAVWREHFFHQDNMEIRPAGSRLVNIYR